MAAIVFFPLVFFLESAHPYNSTDLHYLLLLFLKTIPPTCRGHYLFHVIDVVPAVPRVRGDADDRGEAGNRVCRI